MTDEEYHKPINHVRGWANLVSYRAGNLWYQTEDTRLMFTVPVDDCGSALFPARMKSMELMRWIRKYLELSKEAADAKSAS